MQKLLQRTSQAEKQVVRRSAKLQKGDDKRAKALRGKRIQVANTMITSSKKDAQRIRREDWEMGPLAPRRDIPERRWGIMEDAVVAQDFKFREDAIEARCRWAGGKKHLCLAVGDRVVVMEGPLKGSIGPITKIEVEGAMVEVEGVNTVNRLIPSYVLQPEAKSIAMSAPAPIPIDAVRLVHPMKDPKTGHTRDVIVRELKPVDIYFDRPTRRTEFNRVVPGLNVQIPWPPKPDPVYDEHPGDTLRIDAEVKTFVPTLLRPPVPEALIDELRSRFSRFRTRHEPDYVAKKEAEAAEKAARHKRLVESMRTPLQEFHMQQKAMRRARGQPVLTDDMLVKIGEVMARNNARMMSGSGSAGLAAAEEEEMAASPPPTEPLASSEAKPESQPPPL